MNNYKPVAKQPSSRIAQVFIALFLGTILFLVSLLLITLVYQFWYTGRIYPGISIAGIEVGGLKPTEAASLISEQIDYPVNGRLLLRDGDLSWVMSPGDIGLYLDAAATANNAYSYGRENGLKRFRQQFEALYYGTNLSPVLVFDERVTFEFLTAMSDQIYQPVSEAHLEQQGTDIKIIAGQNGRELDVSATLEDINKQMSTMQDGLVDMVIRETPTPQVNADEQNTVIQNLLSQPLTLVMPENQPDMKGPWVIEPQALASMLTLARDEQNENKLKIDIKTESLRAFLNDQFGELQLYAENARFIFNEETQQIELLQPSITGRTLNVDTSVSHIRELILTGEHTIPLQFNFAPPEINDNVTAQELGITGLIQSQTSYFYGSSAARIQNIDAAAHRFNGLLIAPDETFSMAEIIGDISLDNGYAEAPIIYGDQTIEGVGGGVCQVSTTLFRTVFFAGFPIVERYPHAYRVLYYEKNEANQTVDELVGLDATVFVPLVDFKFTNDSPYWILMETEVNQAYRFITWKLYSTSDGRSVEWETTGPINIVSQPEPLYVENPELEEGEIEQIDWGVDGADVTVERTVKRGDAIINQDTFFTHYKPWRDVYEYGPGTEIPETSSESEENPESQP